MPPSFPLSDSDLADLFVLNRTLAERIPACGKSKKLYMRAEHDEPTCSFGPQGVSPFSKHGKLSMRDFDGSVVMCTFLETVQVCLSNMGIMRPVELIEWQSKTPYLNSTEKISAARFAVSFVLEMLHYEDAVVLHRCLQRVEALKPVFAEVENHAAFLAVYVSPQLAAVAGMVHVMLYQLGRYANILFPIQAPPRLRYQDLDKVFGSANSWGAAVEFVRSFVFSSLVDRYVVPYAWDQQMLHTLFCKGRNEEQTHRPTDIDFRFVLFAVMDCSYREGQESLHVMNQMKLLGIEDSEALQVFDVNAVMNTLCDFQGICLLLQFASIEMDPVELSMIQTRMSTLVRQGTTNIARMVTDATGLDATGRDVNCRNIMVVNKRVQGERSIRQSNWPSGVVLDPFVLRSVDADKALEVVREAYRLSGRPGKRARVGEEAPSGARPGARKGKKWRNRVPLEVVARETDAAVQLITARQEESLELARELVGAVKAGAAKATAKATGLGQRVPVV